MELDVQTNQGSNTRKPHSLAVRLMVNLDQKSVVVPPKDLVLGFRANFPYSDLPAAIPRHEGGIWFQWRRPTNPYPLCARKIAMNPAAVGICPYRRVG